jgi:hypothetical protein
VQAEKKKGITKFIEINKYIQCNNIKMILKLHLNTIIAKTNKKKTKQKSILLGRTAPYPITARKGKQPLT